MSKATNTAVVAASKVPTVVANETEALDYALDLAVGRTRPIVALNDDGELVVCCKATAKKHGWEIQGRLFARVRASAVPAELAVAPKAPAKKAPKAPRLVQLEKSLSDLLG